MMVDQGADLIVDAMRAANPQRVRESTERLRLLAETTGSVPSMEELLSAPQAQAARGLAGQGAASLAAFHPATSGQAATGKSPYELFEISVLSTLFEIMLPKSASAFGAGFSGNGLEIDDVAVARGCVRPCRRARHSEPPGRAIKERRRARRPIRLTKYPF